MMLKSVMWSMFKDTGDISAYLYYRNCKDENEAEELVGKVSQAHEIEDYHN